MREHVWTIHLLTLLIISSCGDAFESKPKVVNKRSGTSSPSADAVAWRDPSGRTVESLPDGTPAPGTVNPGQTGNANPADPGNYGGNSGNSGNTGTITPPPVQTGSGEAITLANGCYRGDQFLCQIEIALANKTNVFRASLGSLTYSSSMAWVARDWSQQQAAANSLGHGGFPAARYTKYSGEFGSNTPVNFSAENVAYAYGSSTSPDEIANELMNLWLASSGHRENILGDYKTVGIGVAKTGNYYYATQLFGR